MAPFKIYYSSNMNGVMRAVLNPLLFFNEKISQAPKAPKAKKAQKRNQAKVQNATSEQKLKMRLKTSKGKKVTYSLV